jgi:PAS domain S-box-containing protein
MRSYQVLIRGILQSRVVAPIAANLRPNVNPRMEWVWLWVRIPTVLVGAVGAGLLFPGADQLPLVYAMTAAVWVYSVGLMVLLRRGFTATAFVVGTVADSLGLMATWWIILQIPRVEATPTDLYLILFPVLIAGIIRLGPVLGSAYSAIWVGWMAVAAWGYHGQGSYAVEQFPIRVLFLTLTVGLTSALVSRIQAGREQLAESEESFRNLFEVAPAGIALVGTDQRLFSVNEELTSMLMVSRDELIGHRLSEFEDDDLRETGGDSFDHLSTGQVERLEMERRLLRGDDTFIWVNTISPIVRDRHGDRLCRPHHRGHHREENRGADEGRVPGYGELRIALAPHGDPGIDHLGVDRVAGRAFQAGHQALDIAASGADRMRRLVDDILDAERMSIGSITIQKRESSSERLVRMAVQGVSSLAGDAGVEVVVSGPDVNVEADPDRIIQTLTNLLTNAVKCSPVGGTVRVTVSGTDDPVRFSIEDEGRGVPQEHLKRIFDRFQQVETTDSRALGGSGLGLTIAKSIIAQHGGHIWAESPSETGSTFVFVLPR